VDKYSLNNKILEMKVFSHFFYHDWAVIKMRKSENPSYEFLYLSFSIWFNYEFTVIRLVYIYPSSEGVGVRVEGV